MLRNRHRESRTPPSKLPPDFHLLRGRLFEDNRYERVWILLPQYHLETSLNKELRYIPKWGLYHAYHGCKGFDIRNGLGTHTTDGYDFYASESFLNPLSYYWERQLKNTKEKQVLAEIKSYGFKELTTP